MQAFMVQVPPGVSPGQQFHAIVGQQKVAIVVPAGVVPGQRLQIQVPVENAAPPQRQAPPRAAAPSQPQSMLQQMEMKQRAAAEAKARKEAQEAREREQKSALKAINKKRELAQQPKAAPASRGAGAQRVNVNHPDEISALWWLNMGL